MISYLQWYRMRRASTLLATFHSWILLVPARILSSMILLFLVCISLLLRICWGICWGVLLLLALMNVLLLWVIYRLKGVLVVWILMGGARLVLLTARGDHASRMMITLRR